MLSIYLLLRESLSQFYVADHVPSQPAYNARHDTTHASVSWLTAPLDVIGLATELATSRLPVRHASFLLRHTY